MKLLLKYVRFFIIPSILFSFIMLSCSKDDDKDEEVGKLIAVTSSELESTPSFTYDNKYIVFENGTLRLWDFSNTGYPPTYKYTISGDYLNLSHSSGYTYKGHINKMKFSNGRWKLIIRNINDDNLPKKLNEHWEYSSIKL